VRCAFEKEYEKVYRKWNITKIIHDTYVKEIARVLKKQDDDERKELLEAEQLIVDAQIAMQKELAAAEEERKAKLLAIKKA
jgi:uncharacterized protein YbbC (DUF1343 family)